MIEGMQQRVPVAPLTAMMCSDSSSTRRRFSLRATHSGTIT
jgi:hypothetical protein